MSAIAPYSLRSRLVSRLIAAHAVVLAANIPYFLWRGYVKHDAEGNLGTMGAWLLHELVTDVLPLVVPLFIATTLITKLTVRRSLAQIDAATRKAAAFDPSHLGVRLPSTATPKELHPLVDAINAGLDRLERGFESQKRFTANAAHELRTPLAVLKARCSRETGPQARALLSDIGRMTRIVDQLLGIARLEMGQVPLDARVDLDAVCRRVVADLFPLALAAGCDLGYSAGTTTVLARGNEVLLEDALRNIVDNAVHVAPPGTSVEVVLDDSGIIHVLDRGPGVADGLKTEIFHPFRRLNNSNHRGAGLGLGIAAEAIALHGGTLSVHDRPGGGADFVVDLSAAPTPSG
ncbi:sensor histidine kinase [Magnetospirillum gryphiswaldense]|uniref:histidine kinase n=1 Tax=Magnetospirillum gryphiswaldense TaxID=55518 RepID=A4U104_9PROT|nr:ATP-binding protein [Magnetospirillum gryphiswaldense]AVM75987.1 Sensor protein QseC [Magnetospirillum gryphiswaldense MSR-1]AVM79890.1 Sensor protein QseC [Magnetospirillum gryphiswaldense]CAM76561.1 two-component sensor kinase [Magnetospirillum gryphiswaldense MSR-1]